MRDVTGVFPTTFFYVGFPLHQLLLLLIVGGFISNALAPLLKWLWGLKASTKTGLWSGCHVSFHLLYHKNGEYDEGVSGCSQKVCKAGRDATPLRALKWSEHKAVTEDKDIHMFTRLRGIEEKLLVEVVGLEDADDDKFLQERSTKGDPPTGGENVGKWILTRSMKT
ncbi:hypothetical protein C5167_026153 [Papaver somniferum]|nr:hypothetical protein C5167_026153 [Papaver somniferum]